MKNQTHKPSTRKQTTLLSLSLLLIGQSLGSNAAALGQNSISSSFLQQSNLQQSNLQLATPIIKAATQLQVSTIPVLNMQQVQNLSTSELNNYLKLSKIDFNRISRKDLVDYTTRPSVTKVGSATSGTQNTPDGQMLCSTQRYNLRSAPPEYAMKTLDQDKLWVGSFVKTQGLELGSMQTINVPEDRRLPFRITSALPTTAGSATIAPNQTAYNLAAAAVRQGILGSPFGSTIRYEITEQSSADTSALKIGLKASGIGYSVNAAGSMSSQDKQNRVSAVFVQNAFTMNSDLGGRSPKDAFLSNATPEDLAAVDTAAYVDSITYGRLLFVEMTSSYTSSQMRAALDASYMGVSGSMQAEVSKVLSSSKFNVYAAGGNEQAVVNLIRSQKLGDYFQGTSDPRALVPISFTARNFNSGTYAASASTGEYAETVCNPNSLKVMMRVSYRSIEPNDSKYDDIFGELTLDGREVWRQSDSNTLDLYKGQTLNMYSSQQPITLNYDEARSMSLNARLMDKDVGPNDVVGLWNERIDLGAVANEFKSSGSSSIRREFRKHGEDDADGILIVEFLRN